MVIQGALVGGLHVWMLSWAAVLRQAHLISGPLPDRILQKAAAGGQGASVSSLTNGVATTSKPPPATPQRAAITPQRAAITPAALARRVNAGAAADGGVPADRSSRAADDAENTMRHAPDAAPAITPVRAAAERRDSDASSRSSGRVSIASALHVPGQAFRRVLAGWECRGTSLSAAVMIIVQLTVHRIACSSEA